MRFASGLFRIDSDVDTVRTIPDLPFDESIKRLEALKQSGLISAEEFATTKGQILRSVGR